MGLFDFLFGSDEQHERAFENALLGGGRSSRLSGGRSGTDADDWQCGEQDDHDGMYGFDSYEENDF